jgi:cysteine-rich repeat protein
VDRGQLRQVLLNLVINATEALAGQGTVTLRVAERQVSAAELARGQLPVPFSPGPAVVIEVVDTGIGMTEETLARVFEPFFSTKQQGRGLGLASVTGIVRRHGAGLRVESMRGQGSTFSLYFRPEAPAVPAARPEALRFGGQVLVVDDEPLVARSVGRLLQRLGFTSVVATSGAEAIAQFVIAPHDWAVVVCDVLMPGLGGAETVTQLRGVTDRRTIADASNRPGDPGALCAGRFDPTGVFAGDNVQPFVGEECDDTDNVDGDGCDRNCRFSGGGNGARDDTEDCDDGNGQDGDGCSRFCVVED